jgi:hypothetical protein
MHQMCGYEARACADRFCTCKMKVITEQDCMDCEDKLVHGNMNRRAIYATDR